MSHIKISAIVAAAENNCIGINNDLPWHLPGDLKRLKSITMGKALIMGRKTHESVSARREGKPLPGRVHVVISRNMPESDIDGIYVVRSVEEAFQKAKEYSEQNNQDEMIIFGGAQIYELALPQTHQIYFTRVHQIVDGDAFFPELAKQEWNETLQESHETEDGLKYDYLLLERS